MTTSKILCSIVSLVGFLVVLGWLLGCPWVVMISASWAPMQFNTALCLMICGLCKYFEDKAWTKWLIIVPILVGSLTLFQYMTCINMGIDTLFFNPWTDVNSSHIGRMAPNTSLCFILYGISLFASSHKLILCASVFGISLSSLIGYFCNAGTHTWGMMTGMAFHTAFGFLFLGISTLLEIIFTLNQYKEKIDNLGEELDKKLKEIDF